jgi:CheY-like chemotaxis protein
MPEGGTILLRTRVAAAGVALDVADTGVGMTEDVRQRCLDPFFTTKGKRGSGLGLGIVYGVAQRHHGRLDIESAPGTGTTMTLTFPAAEVSGVSTAQAPEPRQASSRFHVLVVEDDTMARGLLEDLLLADGHSVVTSANGFDALTQLQEGVFDLVVTDRAMPTMSGDELAILVKRSPKPVPVIMITGFGVTMADAGEWPPGVDVVLPKPVTREDLREVLSSIGRKARPLYERRRENPDDQNG